MERELRKPPKRDLKNPLGGFIVEPSVKSFSYFTPEGLGFYCLVYRVTGGITTN